MFLYIIFSKFKPTCSKIGKSDGSNCWYHYLVDKTPSSIFIFQRKWNLNLSKYLWVEENQVRVSSEIFYFNFSLKDATNKSIKGSHLHTMGPLSETAQAHLIARLEDNSNLQNYILLSSQLLIILSTFVPGPRIRRDKYHDLYSRKCQVYS